MNCTFVRIVAFDASEEPLLILGHEIIILPVARNMDNIVIKATNEIVKKMILDKHIKSLDLAQIVIPKPSQAHCSRDGDFSHQYFSSLKANAELESCYFVPSKKPANVYT